MFTSNPAELINRLNLTKHPEGGWYRETYRSVDVVPREALPERFHGDRSCATAIYFLLEQGEFSALHRIKSDEIWHFYSGAPLTIHVITPQGEHQTLLLGADISAGESFQVMVPAGCWFGATIAGGGAFSLVGCTVSPGFDFADFQMGERGELLQLYPRHAEVIQLLSKNCS